MKLQKRLALNGIQIIPKVLSGRLKVTIEIENLTITLKITGRISINKFLSESEL